MCVDEKELSAYIDGELSRGKEDEVRLHIAECESCRERAETLRGLSGLIATSDGDLRTEQRREESWDRISVSLRRRTEPPLRSRRLHVPIPIAAAAAFLLVLAGGLSAVLSEKILDPRPQNLESIPVVEREAGEEMTAFREEQRDPSREEMEELIRFLSESGASVEVKIQLPQSSNFTVYGEPQLMRAADFPRIKETTSQ